MKKGLIKTCIVFILILYCLLDRFIIAIPFIIILLLLFITELKSLLSSNLANLIYPKRYLYLILFSIIMLPRSPNIEEAKFQIIVMSVLMVTSFLLYFYIKKYSYFYLILYSTLFISFINHTAALKIPVFDFLMFNSNEVGGNEGVINGWGWSGRFSGILDNPNALAVLLIYSLFISLYILNYRNQIAIKVTVIERYVYILNIILCFYTIFMTQSRKGIVFGIMLLVISFLLRFSTKKIFPYMIGICSIGLLPLLLPNLEASFEGGLNRLESALNVTNNAVMIDNSTAMRLYFINEGLRGFKENPVFGHGINSFRYYYNFYAHNNYIELLFGTGLVGFSIYYSIHLNLLKSFLSNWRKNIFIIFFIIILLFMDVGYVSYESKLNMLAFVTLFLILDYSNYNIKYKGRKNIL